MRDALFALRLRLAGRLAEVALDLFGRARRRTYRHPVRSCSPGAGSETPLVSGAPANSSSSSAAVLDPRDAGARLYRPVESPSRRQTATLAGDSNSVGLRRVHEP